MERLREAERLAEPPIGTKVKRVEYQAYQERLSKAITLYRTICLDLQQSTEVRLEALLSCYHYIADEAIDLLSRWRDMLPFLHEETLEAMLTILVRVTRAPEISSHQRLLTASTLYNRGFIHLTPNIFADLACDNCLLIDHRVEACRYLVASGDETYKELAQECLTSFIETLEYTSEYRYKIITGYTSNRGISTYFNTARLRVPYDEEFVSGLQTLFFSNEANGVRERILSGQHLLGMDSISRGEKAEVGEVLLKIAATTSYDENVRADAADVVHRLGVGEAPLAAREIIAELGYSATRSRVRTVYQNSQNVHESKISECVEAFIEKIITDSSIRVRSFEEVHTEMIGLVTSYKLEPTERFRVLRALNRISIDTATFTPKKVTLAEIFVHIWLRLGTYVEEVRVSLEKRLIEEMLEMNETCSTGHAYRLVNVLSQEDAQLRISWESQVVANVAGRMQARIRDVEDPDLKTSIAMGSLANAEAEDQRVYQDFLTTTLAEVRVELQKEFVTDGYISQKEFDWYYTIASQQWLSLGDNPVEVEKVDNA